MTTLNPRQVEILRIVYIEMRPNVRRIADKLGSPTRLKRNLDDLVQKHCLDVDRQRKEHIYKITELGFRCLTAYEKDLAEDSIARMIGLGQSQALKRILRHARLERVRCKKCGATDWDEGDKKVNVSWEPYDEDDDGFLIPFFNCTGCGAETTTTLVGEEDPGGPHEEIDDSNFIKESVSVETALQEGRKPSA